MTVAELQQPRLRGIRTNGLQFGAGDARGGLGADVKDHVGVLHTAVHPCAAVVGNNFSERRDGESRGVGSAGHRKQIGGIHDRRHLT